MTHANKRNNVLVQNGFLHSQHWHRGACRMRRNWSYNNNDFEKKKLLKYALQNEKFMCEK